MTAEKFNIEPLGNLQKVSSASRFTDQNSPRKKQAKKPAAASEQTDSDQQLEEQLGSGDFHVIDYKV